MTILYSMAASVVLAQTPSVDTTATMSFEEYEPRSTLVVSAHPVTRAKLPFIDVHSHQNGRMPAGQIGVPWKTVRMDRLE